MSTRTSKPSKSASKSEPKPKKAAASADVSKANSAKPTAASRTVAAPKTAPTRRGDDLLISGASASGTAFGRCGGRAILSRLERDLCDRLTDQGVAHSHRPRHFEVRLEDESLAAYAPTMVLRGRGREGKTIVLETSENAKDPNLGKIRAYRKQYGLEFYVSLVAPEEVLDDVHFDTYDEATAATDVHTLVSRLAD